MAFFSIIKKVQHKMLNLVINNIIILIFSSQLNVEVGRIQNENATKQVNIFYKGFDLELLKINLKNGIRKRKQKKFFFFLLRL